MDNAVNATGNHKIKALWKAVKKGIEKTHKTINQIKEVSHD